MADDYGTSSKPFKRKQPDEDEELLGRDVLTEPPIDNEYEDLDNGDYEEEEEDRETIAKKEKELAKIFKAQEPATKTHYDDIKITPFNLQDELEDGEFDRAGNFIFKKDSPKNEDNDDRWAESVDWDAIAEKEKRQRPSTDKQEADQQGEQLEKEETPEDHKKKEIACYKRMLRIMRPDETVQRAIRRLGQNIPKKKAKKGAADVPLPDDIRELKEKLDSMIELAHERLENGDLDIYQKSYEDLEEAINNLYC